MPTAPNDANAATPLDADAGRGTGPTIARFVLATILLVAGINHFTSLDDFRAQVPTWFPARDAVVYISGVIELAMGAALLATSGRRRVQVGLVIAAFFVAVFPGNISQYVTHTDAFSLDSDAKRALRLPFQPLLVFLALYATGALAAVHRWVAARRR